MMKRLEIATSIAIIVVAALLSATLIKQHLPSGESNSATKSLLPKPGTHLMAPNGYQWEDHRQTLLIALRYGCIHCEHDMGFYKKIQNSISTKRTATSVLCIFPDDSVVAGHDLDVHNLHDMAFISDVKLDSLNVEGTPTLLLVDNKGTLLRSWVGELSAPQQDEVLGVMQKG